MIAVRAKYAVNLITVLVSVIALIISIKSYEVSKRQFLEENRPHLLIEPISFKETDSYFKIERNSDKVKVNIQYRLINIGNSIAKNIITPNHAKFIKQDEIKDVIFSKKTPISLGPNQKINVTVWIMFKADGTASIDEFIDSYYSGERQITHEFPVTYFTELNPSLTYHTVVEHKIHTDHATILKSEMFTDDRRK